jgi:hypothetical protein
LGNAFASRGSQPAMRAASNTISKCIAWPTSVT